MAEKKRERKKAATKERKPNWQEYTASVEDIQNFLRDRIVLRYNVITRRVEYRAPLVPPNWGDDLGGGFSPLTDRIVNSLWAELSATKRVRAPDIYRVMDSDFVPEFNPFTFYLERLPR